MNPAIIVELAILVIKLLLEIFDRNPAKVSQYLAATDWPWIARPLVRHNRRREMLSLMRKHNMGVGSQYRTAEAEAGALEKLATFTAADVEHIAQN